MKKRILSVACALALFVTAGCGGKQGMGSAMGEEAAYGIGQEEGEAGQREDAAAGQEEGINAGQGEDVTAGQGKEGGMSQGENAAAGQEEGTNAGQGEDVTAGQGERTNAGQGEDAAAGQGKEGGMSQGENAAAGQEEGTNAGQREDAAAGQGEGTEAGQGNGTASGGVIREDGLAAERKKDAGDGAFYIYSWDREFERRLEYVYQAYPEIESRIHYTVIGNGEGYREEIGRLLQEPEAEEYPDMIVMGADLILEYVCSDRLLAVTECGITEIDLREMNPYTIAMATDRKDYILKGVSWQSCPGAFFYRKDLAKELLGVKNPEEMQEKVGSWEKFLETARQVDEASGGKTKILASREGLLEIVMFGKTQPWVVLDGVFQMDGTESVYMEVVYALEREGLTGQAAEGSGEWNAGFADGSVLGYFGGTGFPGGEIEPNCGGSGIGEGTYGLWNVCQGPVPYVTGGNWLGASAGCSDPALAGQIMQALCCNGEVMAEVSKGTSDYMNHKAVMESFFGEKDSDGLFGGQDVGKAFAAIADRAEAFWMCVYDREIHRKLEKQATAYAAEEKDKEHAVDDFKREVMETLPMQNL